MSDLADLLIRRLCLDAGTQSRVGLDSENVAHLRERLQAGEDIDPIDVVFDGQRHYPTDGFHRIEAHTQEGRKAIRARIQRGTLRDAILLSVGANARHGLRRSNADKRRAVETLLKDEEWSKWSNREIARRCMVDEGTVRKIRAELSAELPQMRTVERGGVSFEMDVSGMRREDFDGLSAAGKLRLQQRLEERAQRQREAEERRAAEALSRQEEPALVRLLLTIPAELAQALDVARRRSGRTREAEAVAWLEWHVKKKRKKRR